MEYVLKGRRVVDCEVELAGVDSFIAAATWADTGEPLDQDDLDQLNEDREFVAECAARKLY